MRRTSHYVTIAILMLSVGLSSAQAQMYSVLYNFGTSAGDPLNPGTPGVIAQGRDGNLYSTSSNGGSQGLGSVFRITPTGSLTVLYNFDGPHGQAPLGGLTLGTDGSFYGTTWYGGATGNGTIFRITPKGQLTTLYSFTGGNDGFQPYAPPIEGIDGNFYGTAGFGGAGGFGTAYKVTPSGTFTVLHAFDSTDGSIPIAPLVQDIDGAFYGTTQLGGSNGNGGVVFRISSQGAFTDIVAFTVADGANPYSPVIQATDKNFYGTLSGWGAFGWGSIYKLTPQGSLTVLYDFNGNSDGGGPDAGLVQATDGNLYGVASGGNFNPGTIYRITSAGNFSVLYDFDGASGSSPTVTPLQHTNGLFYGDTTCGGSGVNGGCISATGGGGVFYSLNEGLEPFVSPLPGGGAVGNVIQFLGQGFMGTTTVSFNGVPAKFRVLTDTFLGAEVPRGAKTGFVTVTTPSGTLKSNRQFFVHP
jgi:uncharacterized repeat protein (TIGR03803 family)